MSMPTSHEPDPCRRQMRVCVIGAGPSGLVTAKTLIEAGHLPTVFEASNAIGGAFQHKAYVGCRLVSSKYITAFSDFRMQCDELHPTIPQYLEYLRAFTEDYSLLAVIRFQSPIERVERRAEGGYLVFVAGEDTGRSFDAVAVCSGLHNHANIPSIFEGGAFRGTLLHSSRYKEPSIFENKRVLVVGSGETGMDVAYQAVQHASSVAMCVRNGFLSVPHQIGEVALDTMICNLGECCYQHRWMELAKVKWRVSTFFIRLALLIGSGTSRGYNQWVGTLDRVERGHHIINKQCKAMPYMNRSAKTRWPLWTRLWSFVGEQDDASLPEIVTHNSSVDAVRGNEIVFSDGTKTEADVVLLATGYVQRFPFLFPHSTSGNDPLPEERLICAPGEPGLAFIGFVRPNVGAIPPMAELQCLWWIQRMEGCVQCPLAPPTYTLLSENPRTGAYAVDYGAYMHDLARDTGAMPDLLGHRWWWWLTHPKVLFAYCLGQAYIPFFRLQGPFAPRAEAARKRLLRIVESELLSTVLQRGLGMNFAFAGTAFFFSVLNAACWMLEAITGL